MKNRLSAFAFAALGLCMPLASQAQVEIQWWHSMVAVNGEWVNDLAKQFNESQKEYKVVPTFKGSYDESMTASIAAFRAGNVCRNPCGSCTSPARQLKRDQSLLRRFGQILENYGANSNGI